MDVISIHNTKNQVSAVSHHNMCVGLEQDRGVDITPPKIEFESNIDTLL